MTASIARASSVGISYLSAGSGGVPLVMAHGIGSNALSFAPVIERLAGERRVVAWDAPGYGQSEPLAGDLPQADDYATALAGLIDRLRLGKVDLLGHSLGAIVAGRLAAREPARIGRLILSSPALGYGTRPGEPLAAAAAARLDGMLSEGAARFAETRGPRLVHARDNAVLVEAVVKAMAEVRMPGYGHASRMLSMADLMAEAPRIAVPTLVMVGADDEITTPANCRRLFDALAAARPDLGHRFELVPAAGHAVAQEQPEAVARLVASHLSAAGA